MATPNRSSLKTRNVSVSAGIDLHIAAPVTIGGEAFTPPELKGVFAAHTAALDAADSMRKQWADQLVVVEAAGARASAAHRYLRSYLVGQFGDQAHAILNDFGMSAPKPRGPKTVKRKAEALDKRAATRVARHTMGKNQEEGRHRRDRGRGAGSPCEAVGVW